jgi:uncharacterized protein
MKHPSPNPAGTSAAHWRAAAEGRLALPCCASCQRFHWPVRARCPHCTGSVGWRDASGRGRIATFSVVHRAVNAELAEDAPYVVAFVDLDEGVRVFGNIVEVTSAVLCAGLRVRCRFEATLDGGGCVPAFVPEAE